MTMQQMQPTPTHPTPAPTPGPSIGAPLPPFQSLTQGGRLNGSFGQLGFSVPSTQIQSRIIANIAGLPKSGKTYLALGATSPIVYFAFDSQGIYGVVEQFARLGKEIILKTITIPPNQTQDVYGRVYTDFLRAVDAAVTLKRGTIVIDLGSDLHDLVRLALYGKLKGVGTLSYEQRNAEMEAVHDKLTASSLNVIYLHGMKKEWGKAERGGKEVSVQTGNFEVDQWEKFEYLVQINIMTQRSRTPIDRGGFIPGPFEAIIDSCRLDANLTGKKWVVGMGEMDWIPKRMQHLFGRDVAGNVVRDVKEFM